MIGIIDYGLGNIQAFLTVYNRLGLPAMRVQTLNEMDLASHLILPGVGAFDHAMELLDASGLQQRLKERAAAGTPVLGVCVGMQILADGSDEGSRPGLGLVPGRVKALAAAQGVNDLPMPHMGWNDVRPRPGQTLFDGLDDRSRFYFLHSFYLACERDADVIAEVEYGARFCCAVRCGSVHGAQFHPEKSHDDGMRLLRNFAEN